MLLVIHLGEQQILLSRTMKMPLDTFTRVPGRLSPMNSDTPLAYRTIFRDDRYIMSYGDHALQDQLSYCAAKWLHVHRYFNDNQTSIEQLPTISMLEPSFVSPPNTIRLQFGITHSARLHQAQLLTEFVFLVRKSIL